MFLSTNWYLSIVKWLPYGYRYTANLDNKRIDLFDGPAEDHGEENVLLASSKCEYIRTWYMQIHIIYSHIGIFGNC